MTNVNKDDSVAKTLQERDRSYGDANKQFALAQALKHSMRTVDPGSWDETPPVVRESMDMIMLKVSRIICGDFNHADSYHDIAGYAKLAQTKVCEDD